MSRRDGNTEPIRAGTPFASNVVEDEAGLLISVPLPGVRRENVDIDASTTVVTIAVRRTDAHEIRHERHDGDQVRRYRRSERHHRNYVWKIPIPRSVSGGSVTADLSDGLLAVRVGTPAASARAQLEMEAGAKVQKDISSKEE